MSEPRKIRANIANFTPDGAIIAHGSAGEHLILELGPSQVLSLHNDLSKYVEYYKPKERPLD